MEAILVASPYDIVDFDGFLITRAGASLSLIPVNLFGYRLHRLYLFAVYIEDERY